ncbi:MAG: hypothetical protein IPP64_11835 [Bacteroidetes bacterium]|nr:hypothetical protein [Bacteroidota bacterium]
MKKLLLFLSLFLCSVITNAQTGATCISAINLTSGNYCPIYSATSNQITWFQFIPDSTNVTVEVSAMFDSLNLNNRIVQLDLYSGTCSGMTLIESTTDTSMMKSMFLNPTSLIVGQTYFIQIYNGIYNTDFSICLENKSSSSVPCGNKISNGGFESFSSLPDCSSPSTSFRITRASGWMDSPNPFSSTGARLTPDYQNILSPIVPACFSFLAPPRTANGSAGVGSSTASGGLYREYILNGATGMVNGATYKFEFYYKRIVGSDPSNIAVALRPGPATMSDPLFGETPLPKTETPIAGGWVKVTTFYTHATTFGTVLFAIGDYFSGIDHSTNNYWSIDDVSMVESPIVTVAGPPTFCAAENGTVTFTANTSTGSGFTWTCSPALPSTSFSSSGNVATLSGPIAGQTTTVIYTITLTCTTTSGCISTTTYPYTITAPPALPTISYSNLLCAGGTSVLSVSTIYPTTIQWYLNGLPISGATSVNYTASIPGIYTVQISYTDGSCPVFSNPFILALNPNPIVFVESNLPENCPEIWMVKHQHL